MIKEEDFTVDISSPSFMGDGKVIKKITHIPTGYAYTTVGSMGECNKEIMEWLASFPIQFPPIGWNTEVENKGEINDDRN